jgi:poly-gamma-glutamate synthesis protein (capsule biosynthesis protein)
VLDRRELLLGAAGAALSLARPRAEEAQPAEEAEMAREGAVRLFLAGDVMTGRGIDQVLPHPGDPGLHERWVRSAVEYVRLAERAHGEIPQPVGFDYVWGDALEAWEWLAPDVRIVNLETAITVSAAAAPRKGIHYRMHPDNSPCLAAARLDACALANNHVLDWGEAGLAETLSGLDRIGIAHAGAGRNLEEARAPALLPVAGGASVLVYSWGSTSSGIPAAWAAGEATPGVDLLPDLSEATVEGIARRAEAVRRPGDLVVASIHWGPNWGWEIAPDRRRFSRRLVEVAGVDLVHGHSSHHPLGIEVHRGRPVLHGCGDFLTDYEGIGGHEEYRPDLAVGYFVDLDRATGELAGMALVPFRLRRFRLERAPAEAVAWLAATLDRESRPLGARVRRASDGELSLAWD